MTKFNFLKISKTKKIRYLNHKENNGPYILFLHGFMSDLEGKKPKSFLNFAKKNKMNFIALEYSGHGKSSGKFTSGNISKWTGETGSLINKVIKKKEIILIGSSMGSWISLNLFKTFKKQIKGFLGIGSAPEFLERLMWKKFSPDMKKEITKKKIINLKHGDYEYPITIQLIKDGRKNKVLNKKYISKIPVTMVHGSKDEVVPVNYSKKILNNFKKAKKKILVIKNGDHSLSSKKNLKRINKELDKILYYVLKKSIN